MARTHARVSRSFSSTGVRSFTALARAARTDAESTSYCCAPAWAASAAASAAAAISRRSMRNRLLREAQLRLRESRGFGERQARCSRVAPVLVFDDAFLEAALAHDEAMRDADELLVGEEHAGALVAVVEEDLHAGRDELRVELFGGIAHGAALLVAERDHRDGEGRHRIGPDDAALVEILLDGRGDDARDADAVAAHLHRLRRALLVDVVDAHLLRVGRAQLEDVTDLDAADDLERALAVRRGIAGDDVANIGDDGIRQVAVPVHAGHVEAVLVRARAEVAHGGHRAVGDDPDVMAHGAQRARRSLEMRADLAFACEAERLQALDLRGLDLVQHVVASNKQHDHLIFRSCRRFATTVHHHDRLHCLLDRDLQELGHSLAGLHAGCRNLRHGLRRRGARRLWCDRFGELDVRRIVRAAANRDRVLAGGCEHLELVRPGAADLAGVRGDRAEFQPEAREDPRVGVVHRAVALLQALEAGVEGVGVLHRELARAHDAEARPDLVAELGLDLVEVHGKLPVALHLLADDVAEHFLGRGGVAELALGAVLDAQHQGPIQVPASRLLPELGRLHGRREHLQGAGAIHFLADDGLDLAHHAQPQGHPGVQAAGELPDEPRAQHQPVAGELRFLGGFLEGDEVVLAGAHELGGNLEIKSSGCGGQFYTFDGLGRWLASARKL